MKLGIEIPTQIELCSGKPAVCRRAERQMDGRTGWIQYTPTIFASIQRTLILLFTFYHQFSRRLEAARLQFRVDRLPWNLAGVFAIVPWRRLSNFIAMISIKPNHRVASNIRRISVDIEIVDHSGIVGASPAGAAPTTSSFSTLTRGFIGLGKDKCKARRGTFRFGDLVRLILEVWRQFVSVVGSTFTNTEKQYSQQGQAEPWWRASIWRSHRKVVIKQCSYHNNIIDIQNRLPYSKVVYPAIIVLFSCLMEVNHGVRTGPDYPFR